MMNNIEKLESICISLTLGPWEKPTDPIKNTVKSVKSLDALTQHHEGDPNFKITKTSSHTSVN